MKMLKQIKNIIKGNNPKTLLVFNLILFGCLIAGMMRAEFSLVWIAVSGLMYFLMICCGISMTFHRALTHKAFTMPKWLERIFATFACMAGTGSPIMWVLTHRQHHRFSDKPGDPHPPSAVYKTLFGVYPRVSGYIRDIVVDKYYRFWHRYYFGILVSWAVLIFMIFGFNALYFIFVMPVSASIFISNALNWFGHRESTISYKNYSLTNDSQNNWIMAILAFGEGWHNNHHRYPGSARFGIKRYEVDISYLQIKFLQYVGLAKNVKLLDNRQ